MSVTTLKQSLPRARRLVPREHISSRVKVALGLGFVGLLILAALVFPLPHSPTATNTGALLQSPSRSLVRHEQRRNRRLLPHDPSRRDRSAARARRNTRGTDDRGAARHLARLITKMGRAMDA